MHFRQVGYFQELKECLGNCSGESLSESRGLIGDDDIHAICQYLRGGYILIAGLSRVDDWFDGAKNVARSDDVTDGEWVWPICLAYYVEKHRVGLPPDFVQHMEARQWVVPQFTDEEGLRLCNKLREDWDAHTRRRCGDVPQKEVERVFYGVQRRSPKID